MHGQREKREHLPGRSVSKLCCLKQIFQTLTWKDVNLANVRVILYYSQRVLFSKSHSVHADSRSVLGTAFFGQAILVFSNFLSSTSREKKVVQSENKENTMSTGSDIRVQQKCTWPVRLGLVRPYYQTQHTERLFTDVHIHSPFGHGKPMFDWIWQSQHQELTKSYEKIWKVIKRYIISKSW